MTTLKRENGIFVVISNKCEYWFKDLTKAINLISNL